tara:strand:+ start:20540 stop:21952 length:1413 start_codon:yes stop_codon:yes gene_type:complete
MKNSLFIILSLLLNLCASAQIFDVETIENTGDDDKRINLVILSEGYQVGELDKFITDATNFTNAMFSQSPFLEYADYFNIYAIKVPSNQSGADHPATAIDTNETGITPTFVDTYFNATFDAFGYHRYLFYGIDYADAASAEAKIISALADNFPNYDQALILVNTTSYGGTGGEFPMASLSGYDLAIHELGHSLFDLKDEYYAGDLYVGEAINMTQETNTNLVKWKNWIGTNSIGIYPHGTSGVAATWYKPRHLNCKMELLNKPFCSVCKEGMVEKIHTLVSPIDSYLPNDTSVENPSFPLNFQLNLINTTTNSLETVWTLNASNFANNETDVSVEETDLTEGINTLTTVVYDATTLIDLDNHETTHFYTVTWAINYSTLGVEGIVSEANDFSISVFPNPSNALINFKFESTFNTALKLDIISMDGKTIASYTVENSEYFQINISTWKQGFYIAKFYTDNTLIANKKLVKN